MSELRKASMADAKAAWEALPEKGRSLRKAVDAMREAGINCPIANLQRWVKRGFAPKESNHKQATIKVKEAKDITEAVKKADQKAMTRMEVIEKEEADMAARRTMLLDASVKTANLQETAGRELLVAQILLAQQISRRAAIIVEVQPEIAAKLLEVLAEANHSTTIVMPPEMNARDDARVINGHAVEKSSTALAIENFLAREGVGA